MDLTRSLRSLRERLGRGSASHRPGLDAVVVNYRTPEDLTTFVTSVDESEPDLPISLVIANVDARPEDIAAAEALLTRSRPGLEVRHVPFDSNVGYARACNAGLLGGDHEVVALFNADTVARPGVLGACREALLANPRWGPLGPRQVDQHGRITAGGTFGTNVKPKIRGFRQEDDGRFDEIRDDAVTVAGSAYFMRRAVWEELTRCRTYRRVAPEAEGAFLPTRLFYEETWCSYHAGAHGYRNVYYGPVAMVHTWHGSIDATGAPAPELFEESRAAFRTACDAHGIPHD